MELTDFNAGTIDTKLILPLLTAKINTFKTPKTQKIYVADISEYINTIQKPFEASGQTEAETYYNSLRKKIADKTLKGSTAYRKFKNVSNFYNYVKDNGVSMGSNPFIPLMAYLKQYDGFDSPQVPSVASADKLLSNASVSPIAYTIFSMIFRLGLKTSEICPLMVQDIYNDPDQTSVKITRNGKAYMIPFTEDVTKILEQFFKTYSIKNDAEQNLFLNSKGRPVDERFVQRLFDRYSPEEEHITAESLRNLAASLMTAYGAPDDMVADQMGVSMLNIQRYKNIVEPSKAKMHAADYVQLTIHPI